MVSVGCFAVAVVLVGFSATGFAQTSLSDLQGHWAEEAVVEMIAAGVVEGYPDGTFRPDRHILRAEFVTLLARWYDLLHVEEAPFPMGDIENHWARAHIRAAAGAGLLTPSDAPDGRFAPGGVTSRLDMARWIARAVGLRAEAESPAGRATGFADDAEIPSEDKGYVQALFERGLVSGYEDGTFRPGGGLTRAEAVVMLRRIGDDRPAEAELDAAESALEAGNPAAAWRHLRDAASIERGDPGILARPRGPEWQLLSERFQRLHARMEAQTEERLAERARDILAALQERNGSALREHVHPDGLTFSPYAYVDLEQAPTFAAESVVGLWDDETRVLWGFYDGTGEPIELTFAEYFETFMFTDFSEQEIEAAGYQRVLGGGNTLNNMFEAFPDALMVEYHHPGDDPEFAGMDWRSLRLIFVQVGQEWFLRALINDQWTI